MKAFAMGMHVSFRLLLSGSLITGTLLASKSAIAAEPKAESKVSYFHQIRPILQANCQGCHQPAKSKGGYVMTDFKRLLAGGDSEGAAITPEHPEKSAILKMVTPQDGEVRMPKGKTPLSDIEVGLIKLWIEQGATDDTPSDAKRHYDIEHPPVYSRPPVISSLDISPDGKLLAVAGFHEVLLYTNDTLTLALSQREREKQSADSRDSNAAGASPALVARLIGLSERVQSIRFSPDGTMLAVAGGDPARLGEVQVWDVQKRKLTVSAPISYDTLYGVSWSPDSKLIAFGCADNTVRAIEAANGKQVLQMGSHSDWALSTSFSVKGDHIISGGRDMSVKLTEVASQRFIDNVTSITPGALKGGVLAVDTHPQFDHVVTAGSDGLPKVYRIFREVKREIGDDAQFIASLFPMTGRVFTVRFSADGKRIACGSGLDRAGELLVCSYDYTNDVPKPLRDIMGKVPGARKPEEQKQLDDYKTLGIHEIARVPVPQSTIYSLAFTPDGGQIAAGGSDGLVRIFNATNGTVLREFVCVPITKDALVQAKPMPSPNGLTALTGLNELHEEMPQGVVSIEVQPARLKFGSANEYAQVLVMAKLASGETVDVTRLAKFSMKQSLADVSPRGVLTPVKDGAGRLLVAVGDKSADLLVEVSGMSKGYRADFVRDVSPVISKLGCNAGTCHGAKEGKNGFKLSLRGYDPETDLRAFTDDLASRRVNVASPDDSLMLLKAIAEVPHEGGRRTTMDAKYYQILRQWIAGGAMLDMKSPRVTKIEIFPQDPVVQKIGSKQQMRVVASYADGAVRDVTAEAFLESGNTDIASIDSAGLLTSLRRGEAPVLARYEGNYVATTLTVMGNRDGFVWQDPPTWGNIDELVAAKWKRMKIEPSEVCTDLEFIRRVYLDLTGLPPSPEDVQAFLNDKRDTREKRDAVVDRLIGSPEFVDFWANKWADLLQCNSKFLGAEGAETFRAWIRSQVETNAPYDQFAREILTATGSNREKPAASYWKILRTPQEAMENTTQLFLATRFNCNKCHDHPFERWTQDQYYHLAAYFAQVTLKEDPKSEGKKIGGTAVDSAKPLYEIIEDAKQGEIKHDRTGKVSPPAFPFAAKYDVKKEESRREQLADWITTPDNRFFASSYANRLWGYLTGAGVIEPLDDTRAGNPARNPALLDYLTHEFINSKFNARHMMTLICKSRTYQLSIRPNKWNEDDKLNYSHAIARRLPAETLFDAVFKVTGSMPQIPGAKPGQRAMQLADAATDTGSGLLATLGRPARQSACECERNSDIRLPSVMALLSGPTISAAINEPTNTLARLVESDKDDHKLIDDVFMRILNRPATESEITNTLALLAAVEADQVTITNELDALEKKLAPEIATMTQAREDAITKAKTNLVVYDDMTKSLRAELEKRRQSESMARTAELKDYEKLLPAQAAFWETKINPGETKNVWMPIESPKVVAATKRGKAAKDQLTKLADGTFVSKAGKAPSDFTIAAQTSLTNITGVLLEVLPDEKLPNFGPGHAPDGNFVLSEFELFWREGTNRTENAAKFTDARADFSQKDYPVKAAIDGVVEGANGWAMAGAPGIQRHTATFQVEHPITSTNGVNLRFVLKQHYGDNFFIGRFRLYVTSSDEPLDFGMPQQVVNASRAPAGQRSTEQAAAIVEYYRYQDSEFWNRKMAAVKAAEPLPKDPKLAELEGDLKQANEPIKLDAYLVQLRVDTKASTRQQKNKRLTVVQDLAWALINSSGFLFNH
jgi:WD40 repeat protein